MTDYRVMSTEYNMYHVIQPTNMCAFVNVPIFFSGKRFDRDIVLISYSRHQTSYAYPPTESKEMGTYRK